MKHKQCTFCGRSIKKGMVTYTEDGEPTHYACLGEHRKHWNERDEYMDLLGY